MPKNKFVRGTCTVQGCTRPHKLRGYCAGHAQRWMRGVEVNVPLRSRVSVSPEQCSESDCALPVKAKGLCQMHYARSLRHGHTRFPTRKKPPKVCSVAGCENHMYSLGMCHLHYQRRKTIFEKYGITWEKFEAMRLEQGGLCAVCDQPPSTVNGMSGKVYDLNVDHNHATKVVRGLLCHSCNRGLGMFQDSPEILRRAAAYLERYST